MKYRSSVSIFAKALVDEATYYRGKTIKELEEDMTSREKTFEEVLQEILVMQEMEATRAAKVAIPEEDWDEIIAYICRYHSAYGFASAMSYRRGDRLLLPWLASVCIRMLDDIGR